MITLFVIKTVDGAELVGESEDKTPVEDPVIYVKDPLEIVYQHNEVTGSVGATFQKYNTFSQNDTIALWKHAIVSMYPANDILIKAHGETLSNIKKEKLGDYLDDKRESLRDTLQGMIEKLNSNTTVH